MTLATIKNQVFTAIAATTTSQVKAWAEQHNLEVDLRSKEGWTTVLNAIAQQLKEQAIARDLKAFWTPVLRFGWHCLRLVAAGFAIAAIYCLRIGKRLWAFVSQFENKGMAPHHIAWYFAKPLTHRVRATVARRWARLRERAIALSARRRVREATVGAVGGFLMFTSLGLIG